MGRPCATCLLPREVREQISDQLEEVGSGLLPRSLASIALEAGVSAHSLARHVRSGHGRLHAPVVLTRVDEADLNLSSVVSRLVDVLESTRRVRLQAEAQGHRGDVLKASDSETRALAVLMQRLGVSDLSTAEALREAAMLGRALGDAARKDPGLAEGVAQALEARGARDMADDLRKAARS